MSKRRYLGGSEAEFLDQGRVIGIIGGRQWEGSRGFLSWFPEPFHKPHGKPIDETWVYQDLVLKRLIEALRRRMKKRYGRSVAGNSRAAEFLEAQLSLGLLSGEDLEHEIVEDLDFTVPEESSSFFVTPQKTSRKHPWRQKSKFIRSELSSSEE